MDVSIHRIKKIVRSKIEEKTLEAKKGGKAKKYYVMEIVFTYEDLSECRGYGYDSDNTLFGYAEFDSKITLFAETKEALKLKVSTFL